MEIDLPTLALRRKEIASDVERAASLKPCRIQLWKHVYDEVRKAAGIKKGSDVLLTLNGVPIECGPQKRPRKKRPEEIPLGL